MADQNQNTKRKNRTTSSAVLKGILVRMILPVLGSVYVVMHFCEYSLEKLVESPAKIIGGVGLAVVLYFCFYKKEFDEDYEPSSSDESIKNFGQKIVLFVLSIISVLMVII